MIGLFRPQCIPVARSPLISVHFHNFHCSGSPSQTNQTRPLMLQPAAVRTQCIALQIQQQYTWIWMSLVLSLSNLPQVGNKQGGTCLRLAVFVRTVTGFYRKERPDGNIELVITHTVQLTNALRSGDEAQSVFSANSPSRAMLCAIYSTCFCFVFFIINCCSIVGLLISKTISLTLNNKFMLYFVLFHF